MNPPENSPFDQTPAPSPLPAPEIRGGDHVHFNVLDPRHSRTRELSRIIREASQRIAQTPCFPFSPPALDGAANLAFEVLVYPEQGPDGERVQVAHCLNRDLVATGPDVDGAIVSLARCVLGQIGSDLDHGQVPFAGFAPAPCPLWRDGRPWPPRETDARAFEFYVSRPEKGRPVLHSLRTVDLSKLRWV